MAHSHCDIQSVDPKPALEMDIALLLDRENISPQSDDQTFHWKLVLMNGIRHKTIITLNCNCLGPIWHNN